MPRYPQKHQQFAFKQFRSGPTYLFVNYLGIQWSKKDATPLIKTASSSRVEWWWFHPSTITGCRDIQQNINNSAFNNYVTAPLIVSLNISASSGRRRMQRSSLEPSCHAVSNGGSINLLRPLDAEIFNETISGAVT